MKRTHLWRESWNKLRWEHAWQDIQMFCHSLNIHKRLRKQNEYWFGGLQINFSEEVNSQVGNPWIMRFAYWDITIFPNEIHFSSIYFPGVLSNYTCSITPPFLKLTLPFVTRTAHSPSRCLSSPSFIPFSVFFVGSISSTIVLNIEIRSGTISKPLILSHCNPPTQIFYTQKTNKTLSPVQILPLDFRHIIYKGLLDSSMLVSQRYLEINVHKIEFMIFLHKIWTYNLKSLREKDTFISWVLGNTGNDFR